MKQEELYVVCFPCPAGYTGKGNPIRKSVAEAWRDRMNKDWPDIKHWIEPAERKKEE